MTIAIAKLIQLEKALASLKIGITDNPTDLERDGAIQRFEYSFDLSWKALKTVLQHLGVEDCKSPIKAFQAGLIHDLIEAEDQELWLRMLDDRNRSTHVYLEEVAISIYESLTNYFSLMLKLKNRLELEFPSD